MTSDKTEYDHNFTSLIERGDAVKSLTGMSRLQNIHD